MSININSEASCRKAYLNYHCYGNTMGISAKEMGEITQAWSSRLSSWQETVSSDENEYEFDDSEYSNYKDRGKDAAKKTTGHDGKTGGQIANGVVDATLSTAGAVVSVGGAKALEKVGIKGAEKALNKFGNTMIKSLTIKSGAKEGGKTLAKGSFKKYGEKQLENSGSWSVAAPLALAVAAKYMASKPNQEAKEACDELQTQMSSSMVTLEDTQSEMDDMADEIIALSDEASAYNEDANENIEEQKTEYDMYYQTLMAIQTKIDLGEQLTDSEKALYKDVVGYLNEIGIKIAEKGEETTENVAELYDEMGTYQDGYDTAAETMGEIEGLTDYAESFDETTRTMCYVEAVSQGLNAGSGVWAGWKAGMAAAASLGFNAWAWACAAMGASAGVMSVKGAKEQYEWAGAVGKEIEMRKETQNLNAETMDKYDEEIDAYDGWMQGVEDLELEIPDDIEPVEVSGLPSEEPTGEDALPDPLKPKPKEEADEKQN